MRLRDLTPGELIDVAVRRTRVREVLAAIDERWVPRAAEIDRAPFLDQWELKVWPGTDRQYLVGLCWGHPTLGDTVVHTSLVTHWGGCWAITEGTGQLYVLGNEDRPAERPSILFGRRGVPPRAAPQRPDPDTDDDIPPIETPGIP